MLENDHTVHAFDADRKSSGDYHAKQWNTVTGPPVVSDWEERELLRRRAFWVKVFAAVFVVMVLLPNLALYHFMRDTFPLTNAGDVFDIICSTFVFLVMAVIPCTIFFYFTNSISTALKSSAELYEKIEGLQKLLKTLEKDIAKLSKTQETPDQ